MPERQAEGRDHHPEHRHVQRPEQADLPDAFVVPARQAQRVAGTDGGKQQPQQGLRAHGRSRRRAAGRSHRCQPAGRRPARPGLDRLELASPRWVKNGITRPPISAISAATSHRPASTPWRCRASLPCSKPVSTSRSAPNISASTTTIGSCASAARPRACAIIQARPAGTAGPAGPATRPAGRTTSRRAASQSSANPIRRLPDGAICPVHVCTAVSRKPATMAMAKPNSISWRCQANQPPVGWKPGQWPVQVATRAGSPATRKRCRRERTGEMRAARWARYSGLFADR